MRHFDAGWFMGCYPLYDVATGTVAQPKQLDLEPAPSYLAPYQYGCTNEVAGMEDGAAQPWQK
jgi:hypothetical protein